MWVGDCELSEFESGLHGCVVDSPGRLRLLWSSRRSRRSGGRVVSPSLTSTSDGIHVEGVGGGLGEDGVGSGAEVLGADADEDTAVGKDADDCRGGAASRAVVGGGHAVADEFVAFAHLAGLCVAFGPAEALGGLGVALAEMFAGPRVALARIVFGIVDEAKLDAGPC